MNIYCSLLVDYEILSNIVNVFEIFLFNTKYILNYTFEVYSLFNFSLCFNWISLCNY